jgi:lipoprotein-anchoring transpeptidase ErfK/SrfK
MMSSRRRRRRGGPFLFLVAIVAIAAATWWLWPDREQAPAAASVIQDRAVDPVATLPTTTRSVELNPDPAPIAQMQPQATPASAVPEAVAATGTASVPSSQSPAPMGTSIAASSTPAASLTVPAAKLTPAIPVRSSVIEEAAALIHSGDLVQARLRLSDSLRSGTLSPLQAEEVRGTLTVLNDGMIFGPEVTPGDPFTRLYEIRPGDALSRIASRQGVKTNWRFVQRINGIKDPARIRVGQRIKLVQGPFHAEVDKKSHRIDVWLGEGDEAIFIRSLPVGLGEFNSTPVGTFRVRRGGKMANPTWTNPRTGQQFAAADPLNPIGEYWIGLDGIDVHNLQEQGFGIHGTIDPDSIGQDRSMGCVRLADDDIAMVYEMLTEGNSVVLVSE